MFGPGVAQVLFTHIWVDAGHVTGGQLTDEFARILAEDLIRKGFQREQTPVLSGVGSIKAPLVEVRGFEPLASAVRKRSARYP